MKLVLALIIITYCSTTVYSQTQWTAQPGSPVLSMNPASGMWGAYGQPSVIMHNDTFKMWYGVAEGADQFDPVAKGRIHYAWSLDGILWNKYGTDPVLDVAGVGFWDGQWLDSPEILWDGTEFKLYYYGDSTYEQGQSNTAIGLATSLDGIHWTRQGKVLQKGALGEWDGKFIESPAAYYDTVSGVYALIYSGIDTAGWAKIGLTVSADGYNWIKYPPYPVMSVGTHPSWNDIGVAVPALIETAGVFEMWYSGISYFGGQYDSARVGYAVSLNGIDWIQYPGNPVLVSAPGETSSFWAVDVLWDAVANEYKMYYEDFWLYGDSLDPDTVNAIFYATAPRDVLFSSSCLTSVSNDVTIISGNSTQLIASGGDYYQWTPTEGLDNINIADPVANPDTTTLYRVLIVNDSCITVDSVLVTVQPTSISEDYLNNKELVKVYPNPFTETTTVELLFRANQHYSITITDLFGKEIMIYEVQGQKTEISGKDLSCGMYFFQVKDNKQIISSGKLILQ